MQSKRCVRREDLYTVCVSFGKVSIRCQVASKWRASCTKGYESALVLSVLERRNRVRLSAEAVVYIQDDGHASYSVSHWRGEDRAYC